MEGMMDPRYQPTRDEITEACREIQSAWSEQEELSRRGLKPESLVVELKRVRSGETEPGMSYQIHKFVNQGGDSGR